MSYLATILATNTGENIYPKQRRQEALSIQNFFSNSVCSLSPLLAELTEPWPIIILLAVLLIALPLGLFMSIPPTSPHHPARKQELLDLRDQRERERRKDQARKAA